MKRKSALAQKIRMHPPSWSRRFESHLGSKIKMPLRKNCWTYRYTVWFSKFTIWLLWKVANVWSKRRSTGIRMEQTNRIWAGPLGNKKIRICCSDSGYKKGHFKIQSKHTGTRWTSPNYTLYFVQLIFLFFSSAR